MPIPVIPAAPPPLVRQLFSQGTEGWVALGDVAKADRTDFPAFGNVPAFTALRFEYSVDNRSLNLLTLPVGPGTWSLATRLSFSVKVSQRTTLALSVQEKGGGRWSAVVHCPDSGWQDVRLDAADFQLSRDSGAPADPDDRLDLGVVEQVVLLDFAQVAVRAEGPLKGLFPTESGPRTLWMRDFTVESGVRDVDGLHSPQLGWVPIGGAAVSRTTAAESPLGAASLKAILSVGPTKIAGLMRPLPESVLAGAKGLRMRFCASDAVSLVVQLEDAAGGKFSKTIELPGSKVLKTIEIDFESLAKSGDSKTERLDTRRIRQVLLLDASGLTDGAERTRTVWTADWEAR